MLNMKRREFLGGLQPLTASICGMRVAAIREAGKRSVIGEGEHACARLDSRGNSPMHT